MYADKEKARRNARWHYWTHRDEKRAYQRAYWRAGAGAHETARRYGLTLDEYGQMDEDQDWCCAICHRDLPLVVDHDHATKEVRALLCGPCNSGIGLLGDNAFRVARAAEYLQEFM